MTTKIAQWGNSNAVRVPKPLLSQVGLKQGDPVDFFVNTSGNIEMVSIEKTHRLVKPSRKIFIEDLIRSYQGDRLQNQRAWPEDDFIGDEQKAWQS